MAEATRNSGTSVTRRCADVTHLVPADLAPHVSTLTVKQTTKSGGRAARTGLNVVFQKPCPGCSKTRCDIKCNFEEGLTVEGDLLPLLRKKLNKCCGKEFAQDAYLRNFSNLMNRKGVKRRKLTADLNSANARIAALEAKLATQNIQFGQARRQATMYKNALDYQSRAMDFDNNNRNEWHGSNRGEFQAAKQLLLHLKSICRGSVTMRDWFLDFLARHSKSEGTVIVGTKEYKHLQSCKEVCLEIHSSLQILKQCRNKDEREKYHAVVTAAAPREKGKKTMTAEVIGVNRKSPVLEAAFQRKKLIVADQKRWDWSDATIKKTPIGDTGDLFSVQFDDVADVILHVPAATHIRHLPARPLDHAPDATSERAERAAHASPPPAAPTRPTPPPPPGSFHVGMRVKARRPLVIGDRVVCLAGVGILRELEPKVKIGIDIDGTEHECVYDVLGRGKRGVKKRAATDLRPAVVGREAVRGGRVPRVPVSFGPAPRKKRKDAISDATKKRIDEHVRTYAAVSPCARDVRRKRVGRGMYIVASALLLFCTLEQLFASYNADVVTTHPEAKVSFASFKRCLPWELHRGERSTCQCQCCTNYEGSFKTFKGLPNVLADMVCPPANVCARARVCMHTWIGVFVSVCVWCVVVCTAFYTHTHTLHTPQYKYCVCVCVCLFEN